MGVWGSPPVQARVSLDPLFCVARMAGGVVSKATLMSGIISDLLMERVWWLSQV